jgi:dTDP-4-dehydrorhamnose reductase
MSDRPSQFLIVGGDGKLGRRAVAILQASNVPVVSTSRNRRLACQPGRSYLDIREAKSWQPRFEATVAIICAGISSIVACQRDPDGTRAINVDGIAAIAVRLADQGCQVILLSSNRVFDGIRSDYSADAGRSPTTEYGRQMAEIEDRILALDGLGTVLRLTKVLSHEDVLLFGWLQALAAGGKIEAANDMVMAPITADLAVRILVKLGTNRARGIFQMSANRDVTYLEVARKLAAAVGASNTAVESVPHTVLAGLGDLHQLFPQRGQRPVFHLLRQGQGPHEVG